MVHGTIRPFDTAQAHYSGRFILTCEFDEFDPDTSNANGANQVWRIPAIGGRPNR
jgi:hypothetical protein